MNPDLSPEEALELSRRLAGLRQQEVASLLEEAGRRAFDHAQQALIADGAGGIGGLMDFTAPSPDAPMTEVGRFRGGLWSEVLAILRERDNGGA
jgi:hypothetical protein